MPSSLIHPTLLSFKVSCIVINLASLLDNNPTPPYHVALGLSQLLSPNATLKI